MPKKQWLKKTKEWSQAKKSLTSLSRGSRKNFNSFVDRIETVKTGCGQVLVDVVLVRNWRQLRTKAQLTKAINDARKKLGLKPSRRHSKGGKHSKGKGKGKKGSSKKRKDDSDDDDDDDDPSAGFGPRMPVPYGFVGPQGKQNNRGPAANLAAGPLGLGAGPAANLAQDQADLVAFLLRQIDLLRQAERAGLEREEIARELERTIQELRQQIANQARQLRDLEVKEPDVPANRNFDALLARFQGLEDELTDAQQQLLAAKQNEAVLLRIQNEMQDRIRKAEYALAQRGVSMSTDGGDPFDHNIAGANLALEATIAQLQRQLAATEADLQDMRTNADRAFDSADNLARELVALRQKHTQLLETKSREREQFVGQAQELANEVENLKHQLYYGGAAAHDEKEHDAMAAQLRTLEEQLHQEKLITGMRAHEIQQLQGDIQQSRAELHDLQEEKRDLQARLAAAPSSQVMEQVQQMMVGIQTLQDNIRALEQKLRDTEAERDDVRNFAGQATELYQEGLRTKEQAQAQLQQLKSQLSDQERALLADFKQLQRDRFVRVEGLNNDVTALQNKAKRDYQALQVQLAQHQGSAEQEALIQQFLRAFDEEIMARVAALEGEIGAGMDRVGAILNNVPMQLVRLADLGEKVHENIDAIRQALDKEKQEQSVLQEALAQVSQLANNDNMDSDLRQQMRNLSQMLGQLVNQQANANNIRNLQHSDQKKQDRDEKEDVSLLPSGVPARRQQVLADLLARINDVLRAAGYQVVQVVYDANNGRDAALLKQYAKHYQARCGGNPGGQKAKQGSLLHKLSVKSRELDEQLTAVERDDGLLSDWMTPNVKKFVADLEAEMGGAPRRKVVYELRVLDSDVADPATMHAFAVFDQPLAGWAFDLYYKRDQDDFYNGIISSEMMELLLLCGLQTDEERNNTKLRQASQLLMYFGILTQLQAKQDLKYVVLDAIARRRVVQMYQQCGFLPVKSVPAGTLVDDIPQENGFVAEKVPADARNLMALDTLNENVLAAMVNDLVHRAAQGL